ncbi:MAG: pantoate--beta-alanine ligase [Phycisphaerales bacterium]|nr:pantoate--beta-alanine ligase [Phycisphaerales bacterium]
MLIARTREDLQAAGATGSVLVPTMGALHAGHGALMRLAREHAGPAGRVSVSIFVNPTQFNEAADFDRYPRTLEADCRVCEHAGVDVVFAPSPGVMYPAGEDVPVGTLPAVATAPGLEDAFRPGHFAGVCQVVRRLFALVRPGAAVFGEKDWQQLQVIRAMTEGEGLGVRIVPAPTIREPDGLAMSSRNTLLDGPSRARAPVISRALSEAGRTPDPGAAERAMARILADGGLTPEYAVVRDGATLGAWVPGRQGRALIAARLGGVRLIDNAPWPGPDRADAHGGSPMGPLP